MRFFVSIDQHCAARLLRSHAAGRVGVSPYVPAFWRKETLPANRRDLFGAPRGPGPRASFIAMFDASRGTFP